LDHQQLRLAYAAADVLIVPSEYEPFGLVALEGQRMGTPVVVPKSGGLRETIRQTVGGMIFPSGTAWRFAIGSRTYYRIRHFDINLAKRDSETSYDCLTGG